MRINSVQNQNQNHSKKQVNFGCDYCRLTREMLIADGFVGHEVEAVLLRANPKNLGEKVLSELKKTTVTPEKLHVGRATSIYEGLAKLTKKPNDFIKPEFTLRTALQPGGLEALVKVIREQYDDILALHIGSDFNIYT